MICPVCNTTISDRRKKQIKHMHGHSSTELALEILWLNSRVNFYQDVIKQRQEQSATLALDDPGAVFSLVEVGPETSDEDSEEDSDEAMTAASDLYNHMHNLYPSVDPVAAPVEQAAPVEERGDYAEVKYIRIPVDGPEYMLLNALALYIYRTNGHG